jgi:hypothetical protein
MSERITPQAFLEKYGRDVHNILRKTHPKYWREILGYAGALEAIGEKPVEAAPEPTLGEADEDDLERLKKMSIRAMEAGMDPKNPNAQMVRAFHAYLEAREGEKQLEGLTVKVVPATVPDNMNSMLAEQMRRLTEIASRS